MQLKAQSGNSLHVWKGELAGGASHSRNQAASTRTTLQGAVVLRKVDTDVPLKVPEHKERLWLDADTFEGLKWLGGK